MYYVDINITDTSEFQNAKLSCVSMYVPLLQDSEETALAEIVLLKNVALCGKTGLQQYLVCSTRSTRNTSILYVAYRHNNEHYDCKVCCCVTKSFR